METVLIAGLPHHGKTTVAGLLGKLLKLPHANTSDLIYEKLAEIRQVPLHALRAADKAAIRKDLIKVGDAICKDDPAAILKTLAGERGFGIIAGVRKVAEVEAFRATNKCVVLWVIRPEIPLIDDNTDLTAEHADYVVVNTGGIQPIMTQLRRIFTPAEPQ